LKVYAFLESCRREETHKRNFRQSNSRSYCNLNARAVCYVMHFSSDKTLIQVKREGRHDVTIMQQTLVVRGGLLSRKDRNCRARR
jgi:hypothetical protein